jgi:uncharacterized protein (TIGR03435 family)
MRKSRAAIVLAGVMFLLTGAAPRVSGQAPSGSLPPMAADADPSFAVATFKPSKPDEVVTSIPPVGYRTELPMITVLRLLSFAYDVHGEQVAGAPEWLNSEKFDLVGVSDTPGRPNVQQLKTMIQKLLVDRCQLKFHLEKRELSAYVLEVGKGGIKFSPGKDGPTAAQTFFIKQNGTGSSTLTAKNVALGELAHMMQST